MERVAITGIGVISALGLDQHEFLLTLKSGRSGIKPIESVDPRHLRCDNVAAVRGYIPEAEFLPKDLPLMDRFAQFALVAAREALTQAGVEWTDDLRENSAIVMGSCVGGKTAEEAAYWALFHEKSNRVRPLTIPLVMSNAGASHISMRYGIKGPVYTVSTACSSSAHSIGQAFWMVRSRVAPLAIAGGSEAPLVFGLLKGWEAMRVLSKDTCRPFCADRSGLILGEGGAILVLEPLDSALARGARPLAEVVGFGMSSDAGHITHPSIEGAVRAMRSALQDAGLAREQIGYINAHGTATEANDRTETAAIRSVFGKHADKLAVSSTKSMHGHTLGAAGAIEAVASVLALRYGLLPPTANFTRRDPDCDLDYIPNSSRNLQVEACLSNSFAFGGLNAALAFKAL